MIPNLATAVLAGYCFFTVSDGSGYIDITSLPWLVPGTITVISGEDTLSAVTTSRGPSVGLLLHPVPSAGDTIFVQADTMDVSVPKVARLDIRPLQSGETIEMPSYRSGADPVPEGLYISGSKKLGVSLGSGGGISQGTRLSISGTLASGITVNGRITDRDLPLGASASAALSELDQVYIEVKGSTWNAEMGDLEWESTGPAPWRTRASGFAGGVTPFEAASVSGGYGTTGTQRRRTSFLTQEGIQGPYTFAPGGGVTPGSERVFLDGVAMDRGPGSDYTADYAAGQITFSTRRLVRRDQRVEVSYYREGDGFRKNVARGNASLFLTQAAVFEFSGFIRTDDTGVPLGFIMTEEVEEALRNAGEDPSEAWMNGGRFVGEGNGSYTLDSLSRYIWQGPGQGDWAVEFQRPPEGPGDYLYNSSVGGYIWAGEGAGTHLARRYLTIPASLETSGVAVSGEAGALESYTVHSFFSRSAGNLFNSEETTREGTLTGGTVSVRPWSDGPLISLYGRGVSRGYSPPAEIDSDLELRKWGLPSDWGGRDGIAGASVAASGLTLHGGSRFHEGGGVSTLAGARGEATTGRLSLAMETSGLFREGAPGLLEGDRKSIGLDMMLRTDGALTPFLIPEYTAESWQDSLNGSMWSADGGVIAQTGPWNTTISAGGEVDRREGSGTEGEVLRLSAVTSGGGISWNTSGSINHSTVWLTGGGSTSSEAVRVSHSGRYGGTWLYCQYNAGGYVSSELDIVYTWVGSGNGSWSYDPQTGEYYPDPSGDHVRSFVPGQGDTRVLEASLSGGFTWSDSTETAGLDGSFGLSALDPSDRAATYTLAGAFSPGTPGGWNGSLSPYLTWEETIMSRLTVKLSGSDRTEQYSGVGGSREVWRSLELIPMLKPSDALSIEVRGKTAYRRRSVYGARETDENGLSVDPVLNLDYGLSPGIRLTAENRRERGTGLSITGWGFEPHVSFSAAGWFVSGRFSGWLLPDDGEIPVWLFDGRRGGWTLEPSLTAGRNLNRWFRINAFYWGRKSPGSPWEQRGGLEGTVNF